MIDYASLEDGAYVELPESDKLEFELSEDKGSTTVHALATRSCLICTKPVRQGDEVLVYRRPKVTNSHRKGVMHTEHAPVAAEAVS